MHEDTDFKTYFPNKGITNDPELLWLQKPQPFCEAETLCIVCVGPSSVYLGDPPVPAWRQGFTGAAEIIIQQAAGWRWDPNLGNEQHFVVAVALRQLRRLVALPVARPREAKRLTTGFGGQLVSKKTDQSGTPHSCIHSSTFCKHLKWWKSLLKLLGSDNKSDNKKNNSRHQFPPFFFQFSLSVAFSVSTKRMGYYLGKILTWLN